MVRLGNLPGSSIAWHPTVANGGAGLPMLPRIVAVMLIAARLSDVATADLVRDPTAVLDGPFHAGVLSSLGILGWTTAAAISGFGASIVAARRLGIDRPDLLCHRGGLWWPLPVPRRNTSSRQGCR